MADILISDSDGRVRLLLTTLLHSTGRRFIEGTSGRETVALAQRLRLSLIITEWVFPDVEEGGVVQALAAQSVRRAVPPIIVLTGVIDPSAQTAEIFAMHLKPFGPLDLMSSVDRALLGVTRG